MKRAFPWAVLAIPLAGCVSTQYQQVRLDDIFITDGVSVRPYTKAVKLPAAGLLGDTLPLTRRINIGMLAKPETAWFAAYNFDGDKFLDEGEITHGWLVKTAELITGKTFAPDSLRMMGKRAALNLAQGTMITLRGVALSQSDQRRVRAALEATNSPSVAALVESFTEAVEASGGEGSGGAGAGGADGGAAGESD